MVNKMVLLMMVVFVLATSSLVMADEWKSTAGRIVYDPPSRVEIDAQIRHETNRMRYDIQNEMTHQEIMNTLRRDRYTY